MAPWLVTRNVIRPGLARILCGVMKKSPSVTSTRPARACAGGASLVHPLAGSASAVAASASASVLRLSMEPGHCSVCCAPPMGRSRRLALSVLLLCVAAVGLAACGEEGISLSKSDPNYEGAQLFVEHCSGCHTLSAAGTQG